MRNIQSVGGISPRSSIFSQNTNTGLVFLPLAGGGGAAINLAGSNAIQRGTRTILALDSAASAIGGQTVNLSGVTPSTYNGNHKVLWVNGASVCIDLDSSALGDWSSGGTVAFNYVADSFGNLAPQAVAGTITGIWANPGYGITADPTAGSYITTLTSGIDALTLSGFTGILAISFDLYLGANPSGTENVFGAGVNAASGTNSKSGTVSAALNSSGQINFTIRPKTAADAGGTNTFLNVGALTTSAINTVSLILDCRTPSAPVGYAYLNKVLKVTSAITITNMTDWWSGDGGFSFGAVLNAGATPAQGSKLGALASGARVKNFLWGKFTDKSFGDVVGILDHLAKRKELPPGVI